MSIFFSPLKGPELATIGHAMEALAARWALKPRPRNSIQLAAFCPRPDGNISNTNTNTNTNSSISSSIVLEEQHDEGEDEEDNGDDFDI